MSEQPRPHQPRQPSAAAAQQMSPDQLLAALPEHYMRGVNSSTPVCQCRQLPPLHHPLSPGSPSCSSLLSFSDSSASFESGLAASAGNHQLADGRRRLRQIQREEEQLRRLLAGLDSRLRGLCGGDSSSSSSSKARELLAMQRASVENMLRAVQLYGAAKAKEVVAASVAARLHSRLRQSDVNSDGSASDSCDLMDF